ncbi:hypothetical protein [Faecalibacterium prausnitzii]|uniref:hypothetical protein n=1 Tax=Faecalibacterium prausnitzii TaxID=853 RepID=UPI00290ED530|nr:hypothetical protein [Faecalibacterium prausnitzii]MDU8667709.1 hypothetical protein [Faecalibacterium prausnitzii]
MKLFKKVLAAALAGVLALSVLTGCNNSAATVTMVDALNDWSKVYGDGVTFEKGNEDLQNQVNALVKIVDEAGKDIKFGDAKDFREIYDIVMNNPTVRQELTEWAGQFPTATYGSDPSNPLYEYGFADINATLSASSSKNIYYASQLLDGLDVINLPAGDPNRWEKGDTSYVAVATGEINGKKYMVALFKTSIQKDPDYKPNPDKN